MHTFVLRPCRCDTWIRLFHVTNVNYLPAIRGLGLDPDCSHGAYRTWLASLDALPWAYRHVQSCHSWQPEEMVTIAVTIPRSLLRSAGRAGVYYVVVPIPPTNLGASVACQY
jgi:hypothetical protein